MKRLGLGLLTSVMAATAFAPLAAFAPPADAADLPVGPIAPAPAPVYRPALYDWTGIYFGGHVGAGLLDDTISQSGVAATPITSSADIHPAGLIGGGQVGANYEFAPWVVGIEGSWTSTAFTGATTVGTTNVVFPFEKSTNSPKWIAAATGRVGYAADSLLLYVKGGGAWMKVDYTQDLLVPGGLTGPSQTITDTRSGFTAGVGVEYGLTENFSAKLEYDFYDFGTQTYNGFVQTPVSIKSDMHVVSFGLNYRFNWAGGRPY
jgi:outer membrane immunogenic protein